MAYNKNLQVLPLAATPGTPTVTPTGGAAGAYSYVLVGVDANGNVTAGSTAGTTSAGPTTLDGTHTNGLAWTDGAGDVTIIVYRTVGGATQGVIGSVAAGVGAFTDTGQVGDGTTPASASPNLGIGHSITVDTWRDKSWQVGGTFTGTLQLQGTIDNMNWMSVGAAVTAASTAAVDVASTYTQLRVKVTAYTSGTPTAWVAGHHE